MSMLLLVLLHDILKIIFQILILVRGLLILEPLSTCVLTQMPLFL